ncbi:MAG: hypothetical protein IJA20_09325 [Methanocorpusculum sp.]|nr:hypothetical protein [Methanocorpusculum sp.]
MGGGTVSSTHPYYEDGKVVKNPYGPTISQSTLDDFSNKPKEEDIPEPKRNRELHMRYRNEAEDLINDGIDDSVDIVYAGSVAKGTYVEGISDVDNHVRINGTSLEKKSPAEVKAYIRQQLSKLPNVKSVTETSRTVTATYRDGTEMQYVPVIKTKNGYRVADGNRWSNVVYENRFRRDFQRTNKKCGGRLTTLIRILKKENVDNPKGQRMSGHHIEVMANRIFKQAPASKTRDIGVMAVYYHQHASRHIMHRMRDVTGQSTYVDKRSLGGPDSEARRVLSRRFASRARRMNRLGGNQ